MPYKDKEKRKQAWKRWATRNPEKRRWLNNIQEKARRAFPILQRCSVDGCPEIGERHHYDYSKPTEIVWLCKKHHESVHHKAVCKVCGSKHRARGFCNKHWKQWKKGTLVV